MPRLRRGEIRIRNGRDLIGASPLARPNHGDRSLSEVIAGSIEAEIRGGGIGVGGRLGTEGEMMARYGVGRATVREAVRALEARGIARMGRGQAGGLRVTLDPRRIATATLATHLELLGTPILDIFETRTALGELLVELAARRIDAAGIVRLRDAARMLAAAPHSLHDYAVERARITDIMIDAASSPIIAALAPALDRAMLAHIPVDELRMDDHAEAVALIRSDEQRVTEAIVAQDIASARGLFSRWREREGTILAGNIKRGHVSARLPVSIEGGGEKAAMRCARSIAADIVGRGMSPGEWLCRQEDMRSRFGVSLAIAREAIRLLESHGILVVRQGKGGGIRVGEFRSDGIVQSIADAMPDNPAPADVMAARAAIMGFAAVAASARRATIEPREQGFGQAIGRASGNAAIEIIIGILDAMSPERPGVSPEVDRRLSEAIATGDRGLARRYALEHVRLRAGAEYNSVS